MSEKVTVSFRAAVARFRRHIAKGQEKLVKFRRPVDSTYHYGTAGLGSNVITWKGDHVNLLNWIAESGVMKPNEVITDAWS